MGFIQRFCVKEGSECQHKGPHFGAEVLSGTAPVPVGTEMVLLLSVGLVSLEDREGGNSSGWLVPLNPHRKLHSEG